MPRLTHPQLRTADWLREQLEDGRTRADCASELGVSPSAISAAIRRFGLQRKHVRFPELQDRAWLVARLEEGLTQDQIAEQLGCPGRSTVAMAIRRHGLSGPHGGRIEHPELHDPEWLTDQLVAGRTSTDIARELGCNPSAVRKARLRVRAR